MGTPCACGAPGQRNPARRPVRDQARADPLSVAGPRPEQGAPRRRPDLLPSPLPPGATRGSRRRLLDGRPRPHRAREVSQLDPHGVGAKPLLPRRSVPRQAQRASDRRRHRRDDTRRERPADGTRSTWIALWRCRRPRSENRPCPRDGLCTELQPERRRGELRSDREDPARTARPPHHSSTGRARGSIRPARRSRS